MNNYNIAQLFDLAFGIRSIAAYNINTNQTPTGTNFDYSGIPVANNVHEASRMSHLGTPILGSMLFKGKDYQIFNELGDVVLKSFADFELPSATLVNFRRGKIITKTKALAANGTVKEMFGFDDWSIDIRGLCLPDPSHPTAKTAEEQKLQLLSYEGIADAIQVIGQLFDNHKIYNITIDEIDINQLKGKPDVIPFYLKCSSDEPLELRK